jgi:hypothetical protein
MAMFALSFDLGLLRGARTDAQTAANAGALAGASAFQDIVPALNAVSLAHERALAVATANYVRNTQVDTPSVTVEVDHNLRQVYVKVERNHIPMWFARLVGIDYSDVEASATAQASPEGGVNCLRPLAIPDHWHDANNDANGDRIWDPNEDWQFDPTDGDFYARFGSNSVTPPETGYGSGYRNFVGSPQYTGDYGRKLMIKAQNPHQSPTSGFFYPLNFFGAGGGANEYEWALTTSCDSLRMANPITYVAGDTLDLKTGDMVGPTRTAFEKIITLDPNAQWDPGSGTIINSDWGANWKNSRRVLLLAIFDPNLISSITGASDPLPVIDYAYFFVEGFEDNQGNLCTSNCPAQAPVMGRFMYYANGIGAGPAGPLTLTLQLIK